MLSKRKLASSLGLERRVRARREDEWEPDSAAADIAAEDENLSGDEDEDDDGDGDDDAQSLSSALSSSGSDTASESDTSRASGLAIDSSTISFGALARAQASLAPPDRRGKAPATERARGAAEAPPRREASLGATRQARPKPKRSSKHAPQEISSKKPVSRLRDFALADERRKPRDPRFDPAVSRVDDSKLRQAYAFLDEYRDGEMASLGARIKASKNPLEKEKLKRELMSMESKKAARQRKDQEADLLREHRSKEKELVAQGKKPYYLKKADQKKILLTNRYSAMSKGQVDRAIARKRKKVAGKEKKELGMIHRVRDRHAGGSVGGN